MYFLKSKRQMTEETKQLMDKAARGVAALSLEDRDPWETLKKQVRDHPVSDDIDPSLQKRLREEKEACLLMLDLLQAKGCTVLPKVFATKYDVQLHWGRLPRIIFLRYYDSYRVDYQSEEASVDGGGFFPVSNGEEAVVECILKYVPFMAYQRGK